MKRRPIALTLGTLALASSFAFPFISMILGGHLDPSIILFLVFGLLPILFVLYRVLMADPVARAAVTVMGLVAIIFGTLTAIQSFSLETGDLMTSTALAADGVSETVVAQTRHTVIRNGIISSLFVMCVTLGLLSLYVPQSNRCFRRSLDEHASHARPGD